MSKSPWASYAATGSPLDYTPIDATVLHTIDNIPERPSRLWGYVYFTGAFIAGLALGLVL